MHPWVRKRHRGDYRGIHGETTTEPSTFVEKLAEDKKKE